MPAFLSPEWLDELKRAADQILPEAGGSACVQYVVNGGPGKQIVYHLVYRAGRLAEAGLGEVAEPDVTFTEAYGDAVDISRGKLDSNAAFMEGRVKVAGNMAKLMSVLALTGSPVYRELLARVDAETTY